MRYYIWVAILLLGHLNVCTQESSISLCVVVCDIDTRQTVSDAYIFISNSTIGTITDSDGEGRLEIPYFVRQDLIISHISYHPKQLRYNQYEALTNCDTVYIQQQTFSLGAIEIKAQRSGKWKKQFRKFRKAFIGTSKAASKCSILNPEVLHFTESGQAFIASASNLLKIHNPYLGYNIDFLLSEFRLEEDGSSRYKGFAKFTEIEDEDETDYAEVRNKQFDKSPKYFYQALIYNRLEEQGLDILLEKYDNRTFNFISDPNATDLVKYMPEKGYFELRFIEFLTILDNNHKQHIEAGQSRALSAKERTRFNNATQRDIDKIVPGKSHIFKTSNHLKIDYYGNILNPESLQEYGMWANQRMAEQLPYYYGNDRVTHLRDSLLLSHATKPIPQQREDTLSQESDTIINGFRISHLTIPLEDIKFGGVPRDGIPAIDKPDFVFAYKAEYMHDDDEGIVTTTMDGKTRFYPLKILNRHEVVNDGPLVISYCPLCHSGIVFDISMLEVQSFGVSGLLYQSDVLMYDRQTQSLWSQIEGKSIAGRLSGTALSIHPSRYLSWRDAVKLYPRLEVLVPPTFPFSKYDTDPYATYRSSDRIMFPVNHQDKTLNAKDKVLGFQYAGKHFAIPTHILDKVKSRTHVNIISDSVTLTFSDGGIRLHTKDGQGIVHHTMYWFAWHTFHPDTVLIREIK